MPAELYQAYNRVKTRKSVLASEVLDLVKKFLSDSRYAGKPDKIRDYVLWALRPGGPAYYGMPIPQQSWAKPNEPGYIVSRAPFCCYANYLLEVHYYRCSLRETFSDPFLSSQLRNDTYLLPQSPSLTRLSEKNTHQRVCMPLS